VSTNYQSTKEVPLDKIIARLRELSDAIIRGRDAQADEFTMRIPAECDRDADLVLSEAANRLNAMQARVAKLEDFAAFAQMVASRQLDPDYVPVHVAEDMTKILNMSREITGEDDYDDYESAWLLRQKADAVDSFVKWVNPHWPKSLATGIADDAKNYTYELRQAADEADKEQES
jgi:hypothetical protein